MSSRFANIPAFPFNWAAAVNAYLDDGAEPAPFLRAIITNDLRLAMDTLPDGMTLLHIKALISFFENDAPSPCYGSREKLRLWLQAKRPEPVR